MTREQAINLVNFAYDQGLQVNIEVLANTANTANNTQAVAQEPVAAPVVQEQPVQPVVQEQPVQPVVQEATPIVEQPVATDNVAAGAPTNGAFDFGTPAAAGQEPVANVETPAAAPAQEAQPNFGAVNNPAQPAATTTDTAGIQSANDWLTRRG